MFTAKCLGGEGTGTGHKAGHLWKSVSHSYSGFPRGPGLAPKPQPKATWELCKSFPAGAKARRVRDPGSPWLARPRPSGDVPTWEIPGTREPQHAARRAHEAPTLPTSSKGPPEGREKETGSRSHTQATAPAHPARRPGPRPGSLSAPRQPSPLAPPRAPHAARPRPVPLRSADPRSPAPCPLRRPPPAGRGPRRAAQKA